MRSLSSRPRPARLQLRGELLVDRVKLAGVVPSALFNVTVATDPCHVAAVAPRGLRGVDAVDGRIRGVGLPRMPVPVERHTAPVAPAGPAGRSFLDGQQGWYGHTVFSGPASDAAVRRAHAAPYARLQRLPSPLRVACSPHGVVALAALVPDTLIHVAPFTAGAAGHGRVSF